MAPLGNHVGRELPPGFQTRPSQSRPGQLVYLDATTGIKYASLQLAWRTHFERLLQSTPAVGSVTVNCVQACPVTPSVPNAFTPTSAQKALTLADLQVHESAGAAPDLVLGVKAAMEPGKPRGKVALPSFGDALGSQAAYLGYVSNAGCAGGLGENGGDAAITAVARYEAPCPPAPITLAEYSGNRANRALPASMVPKRSLRCNPALQTWQEDPFSQWREA